ncbi:hypothetical protein BGS_1038 [Beggiatoa sp. SS]|nr:hypothetical protein BGS_1038 [Beggiatoa sp. SS]
MNFCKKDECKHFEEGERDGGRVLIGSFFEKSIYNARDARDAKYAKISIYLDASLASLASLAFIHLIIAMCENKYSNNILLKRNLA